MSPHLIGAAKDAGPEEQDHAAAATYGAIYNLAQDPGAAEPDTNPKSSSEGFEEIKLNLLKEVKALMSKDKKSLNHYCWSHGPGNHDSKSCKYPKPGHVATATANKKCGGC